MSEDEGEVPGSDLAPAESGARFQFPVTELKRKRHEISRMGIRQDDIVNFHECSVRINSKNKKHLLLEVNSGMPKGTYLSRVPVQEWGSSPDGSQLLFVSPGGMRVRFNQERMLAGDERLIEELVGNKVEQLVRFDAENTGEIETLKGKLESLRDQETDSGFFSDYQLTESLEPGGSMDGKRKTKKILHANRHLQDARLMCLQVNRVEGELASTTLTVGGGKGDNPRIQLGGVSSVFSIGGQGLMVVVDPSSRSKSRSIMALVIGKEENRFLLTTKLNPEFFLGK